MRRNPFKVAMEADKKAGRGQNLLHQKLAAKEQEVRQTSDKLRAADRQIKSEILLWGVITPPSPAAQRGQEYVTHVQTLLSCACHDRNTNFVRSSSFLRHLLITTLQAEGR